MNGFEEGSGDIVQKDIFSKEDALEFAREKIKSAVLFGIGDGVECIEELYLDNFFDANKIYIDDEGDDSTKIVFDGLINEGVGGLRNAGIFDINQSDFDELNDHDSFCQKYLDIRMGIIQKNINKIDFYQNAYLEHGYGYTFNQYGVSIQTEEEVVNYQLFSDKLGNKYRTSAQMKDPHKLNINFIAQNGLVRKYFLEIQDIFTEDFLKDLGNIAFQIKNRFEEILPLGPVDQTIIKITDINDQDVIN